MKILCPTDLSAHSVIALEYAVNLANDLDAELHIITIFEVPKKAASFVSLEDTIRKNTEEDLEKVMAGITPLIKNDRVPITHVYRGSTLNTILKYGEKFEIDLIVMGTQGGNSLRTLLFGSTTRKVASRSKIPVLAIPETIQNQLQSNRLLLALDNKVLEHEETFKVPRYLAKTLGLKIDILHICTKEEEIPFDPFISSYLEDNLGEVVVRDGQNAVKEIKSYAEDNNIGILIMIRREKSFFQRLLTVGNTSEEIAKTNVPLLILPE